MTKRLLCRLAMPVLVLAAALAVSGPAAATTWCVPDFSAACPDDGENQVPLSGTTPGEKLQAAMSNGLAADGEADRIEIAPGGYTVSGTFAPQGSDELEIVGAGREETVLTSSATSNTFVLNLNQRNAPVTVQDLSVVIPESFPDGGGAGYGAGIQIKDDRLERVDLINRNPASSGISPVAGGRFTDVRITSDNNSKTSSAVAADSCQPGGLKIDGLVVEWSTRAIRGKCDSMPIEVNGLRVRLADTVMSVAEGALVSVTNAVVAAGDQPPIRLEAPTATPTGLLLDHVTMVGDPATPNPAIRAVTTGKAGLLTVGVTNSVITGFTDPWQLVADPVPAAGHIDLEATHSFFDHAGTAGGSATVTVDPDTDIIGEAVGAGPGFADPEFRLAPDSVLIDAGDAAQLLPDADIEGTLRPLDGNLDGTAIRDIGAFEYKPPKPTGPPTPPKPPLKVLKLSKVKFRYRAGRGGRLVLRVSHPARVRAVFRPVPKRTRSGKRRKAVKIVRRVKAGRVVIKLGKRRLSRGRYRLKLTAVALDGSASTGLGRMVRAR